MSNPKAQVRRILPLLGCGMVAGLVLLWWLCAHSEKIAFLTSSGSAKWMLYPKPPEGIVYQTLELGTEFRRSFKLDHLPEKASLTLRALKRSEIVLNGIRFAETPSLGGNWKVPAVIDITRQLRAGSNELSVTVYNSNGPPILWLVLDAEEIKINSDRDWEASYVGAAWRPVHLAADPVEINPGNGLYGGESAPLSLLQHLPTLVCFAVLSGLMIWLGGRWLKRNEAAAFMEFRRFAVAAVIVIVLAWVALFANNLKLLPNNSGFDVGAHEDYINYIRTQHALPLATDGWEMCQAPLYYLISAAVISPLHSDASGDAGILTLRILGMIVGVAHAILILFSLRLLFPGQPGKQLLGFLLAAFLPEQIYLAHYISNESMSAAWMTATLYFCLRLITQDRDSVGLSLATGLCLGAALLTKATTILGVPFIIGAVVIWLRRKQPKAPLPWLRTLGLMLVAAFAVSGWHYLRVWKHFGSPIVNDWDPASGFAWWTDEGFHTPGYYTRFGQSLIHPFYSVFNSFSDGLYSTMWGDGLYGGMADVRSRPPWNYGLMASGCLLATVPTVMIIAGLVACIRRFLEQPEPIGFLMLGLPSAAVAALLYMNLKLPYYCDVKAFYIMLALLPVCVFAAEGWDTLFKRARRFRPVFGIAFGVWVWAAYTSFWIQPGSATTHALKGTALAGEAGREADSMKEFNEALSIDPKNNEAKVSLAVELFQTGKADESIQLLSKALAENPNNAKGHLQLASVLEARGQIDQAIQHAERAIELEPDYPVPYHHLCAWFTRLGRFKEALTVGQEGLRLKPMDPELHFLVACASAALNSHPDAIKQFKLATRMRPEWGSAFELLGVSQVASGRLNEAAMSAAKALALAQANKDSQAAGRAQKLLDYCHATAAPK